MRWHKEPTHRLVLLKDVERLTGLSPNELLRRTDTQQLVRLGKGDTREELVRIPVALLGSADSQLGEERDEKR